MCVCAVVCVCVCVGVFFNVRVFCVCLCFFGCVDLLECVRVLFFRLSYSGLCARVLWCVCVFCCDYFWSVRVFV